jgi:hypothetical protein
VGNRGDGPIAAVIAALRGWLGARPARSGVGAQADAAESGAVPPPLPADRGAESAPDASLHAALAAANSGLWRHALGASGEASSSPRLQELRAAVERLLGGELGERHFPRRPMLMPQLMAALRDPAAAATRLADIIAQDPVLAGNVLRLANSAWYRVAQDPVETLQRAVIVCGTDGLQSLLWERTTRATLAAELYARRVCPGERQGAQLLVLLRALGPLVVFRGVEEQLRGRPADQADATACAALLQLLGGRAALRVAAHWDSSERICGVLATLDGQQGAQAADEVQRDLAVAVEVGELLGTTSVLIGERVWDSAAGLRVAAESGMPREWMLTTLTRLGRAA